MSIEYVLDLKCPVKETIPTRELIPQVHERRQYEGLLGVLRAESDPRPLSEIEITRQIRTGDGVTEQSVSLAAMATSFSNLETLEGTCAGCRANIIARPFGCYGAISYPIKRDTEKWLMERLPESLESPAGRFLMHAIKDCGYDGGVILEMRQRRDLFESRDPYKRRWGSWTSKTSVTSNQVLQMMVGLGPLDAGHCMMTSWFLGTIPHDTDPALVDDRTRLKPLLASLDAGFSASDGQIGELQFFLRALVVAPLVDAPVLIDI